MPELPEVETMVRGLRPDLEGRRIIETEFCPCERRPIQVEPSAGRFRRQVTDRAIISVRRLAKRIIIDLSGDLAIVVEPRMTGLMLIAEPPTAEHRRICWHMKKQQGRSSSFEFWDRRGLGTVRLLTPLAIQNLTASLGPDALEMTSDLWHAGLKGTRRAVKTAMLDQKLVAGIGNLYASEILHLAGVSPKRPAHTVTRSQISRISDATQQVLLDAIRYEGSTLGDGTYRNALNQNGGYQNKHRVYQKEGQQCRQCSRGTIRRIVQAQRATFYCPKCQK